MTIEALDSTNQYASVSMISVGVAALGDNISHAESDTNTQATLTDLSSLSAGGLTLQATGADSNFASSVSGTGGVIAGAAANASTLDNSTTIASTVTDGSSPAWLIDAPTGSVDIAASHTAQFNGSVDSTQASLAGLSGSSLTHTVTSTVAAELGADTKLDAENLTIDAENTTINPFAYSPSDLNDPLPDLNSGSGGLFNASAGTISVTINPTTTASIGQDSYVHLLAPASGVSTLLVQAHNTTTADEYAVLNAGGAVEVAEADALVSVNSVTNVDFGQDSNIIVDIGDIAAGAWSDANLDVRSADTTYGLAGAPAGKAYADYTGSNALTVGQNVRLEATDGIDPADGSNSLRWHGDPGGGRQSHRRPGDPGHQQ